MPQGRPLQYRSSKQMQRIIDLYFAKCRSNRTENTEFFDKLSPTSSELEYFDDVEDKMPLVTGMALALDLTRQGLINYEGRTGFVDTVKRAKMRVQAAVENSLYGGNAAGPIFNLKNNFNWRDERTNNLKVEKTHEELLAELDK